MAESVYEADDHYTLKWDSDLNALVHIWEEFAAGDQFRDPLDSLLDAAAEYGTNKYVVDTRALKAHNEEDKAYLADTWVPKALDVGIDTAAVVPSQSAIAEMNANDINEDVDQDDGDFTHRLFPSMDEARDWIQSQ